MKLFLFAFTALLVIGCGAARKTGVQKNPVETSRINHFPAEKLTLTTNVFFLWKKDVTGAKISEVSTAGDQFAGLKMQKDVLVANQQPVPPELDQKITALYQKLASLTERFTTVQLITATYDGETPTVKFVGWNGTIHKATYKTEGGVLVVEATDPNGDTYEFKMARNKYELVAKNLVSFYGDLTVKTRAGETRQGVIKALGPKAR